MLDRELTPPPDGRISSSSGSPDSVYKSSMDSTNTTPIFSPDGDSSMKSKMSTAYKPALQIPPKFKLDEDSDIEWDNSFASPPQKRPPTLRKIQRARSRLADRSNCIQPDANATKTPAPVRCRSRISYPGPNQENTFLRPPPLSSPLVTPPHKRLRALQINDMTHNPASPVMAPTCGSPTRVGGKRVSPRGTLFANGSARRSQNPVSPHAVKRTFINPFTPYRNLRSARKRNKTKMLLSSTDSGFSDDSWLQDIGKHDSGLDMDMEAYSSMDLREIATHRYKEEFCVESVVGNGEFGKVFKAIHKMDGCTYAIKRSRQPVAGCPYERVSRKEVYAHSVLGRHAQVVRYYSAWSEEGYVFIQNEFCNGGTLAEEILVHKSRHVHFAEQQLKEITRQIAEGLRYIHSQCLVHLDIKPANIFIQFSSQVMQSPESGYEEDISCDSELTEEVTYKIGDFGHVTSVCADELEEGDCRYLPKEILTDDFHHLPKADIFALGLSIYEAATLTALPKNGDKWHLLRSGKLPHMTGYSATFNSLVRKLVNPLPFTRPSAGALSSHTLLCPEGLRSRQELAKELKEERFKNRLLTQQLKELQERLQLLPNTDIAVRPNTRSSRLVGLKVNRSKSLTNL